MNLRSGIGRSARAFAEALAIAEREIVRPPNGERRTVRLRISQIKEQPELFQPREFSFGMREVDKKHVERLVRRTKNVGDLDPIIVVKLGRKWVCVDGHHRLWAYRKAKAPTDEIECEWFPGSAKEAADEALRRNNQLKLEVPQADRYEAAWKRVVIDPNYTRWSKADLVKLCGVSEGMIAHMRKVAKRYWDEEDQSEWAKAFRKAVGPLEDSTWSNANLAFNNVEPRKRTVQERAAALAKGMRARLTTLLSDDPEVTARALQIYDRDLVEPLSEALRKLVHAQEHEGADEDQGRPLGAL